MSVVFALFAVPKSALGVQVTSDYEVFVVGYNVLLKRSLLRVTLGGLFMVKIASD